MIFSSCPKVELYFDGTAVNQEKAILGQAEGRLLIAGAKSLVRVSLLLKHKLREKVWLLHPAKVLEIYRMVEGGSKILGVAMTNAAI